MSTTTSSTEQRLDVREQKREERQQRASAPQWRSRRMDHPQPDEFIVPVEDDKLAPIACDGDTVIVSNVGAFTPGMYVALRLTAAHDYTMILAQFIRREEHLRAVTFLLAFPNSAHAPIEVSAAAIEAMHVIVEVRRRIARP